jgi:hypothetical protein
MKDPTRPYFKVQGTGFLVRGSTVLTNRHVVQKIQRDHQENGFPNDQMLLSFVHPVGLGNLSVIFSCLHHVTAFNDVDIALAEFNPKADIGAFRPVSLGNLSSLSVTEPIAVCGYAYGTSMLAPNGTVRRFGPVVNQGYISSISPFDMSSRIDELLLDVRTAGGMSGSPVFRPGDGSVLGIVYGGWEATTSAAIPIDDNRVQQWLAVHDQNRAQAARPAPTGEEKAAQGSSDRAPLPVIQAVGGEGPTSENNGGPVS